ncbi:macro domain-containing protein [uncultured Pseudoteredinibacter sp.]|uniref:type II toxin-antitoxin system antitoxin DNA ADP-ribosyl glycohydrolase DarG n=1 Tax=uncultured Pseudoteredinibacter sp. TaxID=1641701 RepID=UPI0026041669|nr:macro domain-containing protein [uncultured Pseudoteredinibacter sp.]
MKSNFKYTSGDILKADTEAVVNTVNCVGVMGRGIALQFKKAWPDNFNAYEKACKKEQVQPGSMFIYETGQLTNPLYIINFPTKRHWRGASRVEDIVSGLKALRNDIERLGIKSISLPPLGAGLGGLDWGVVKGHIENELRGIQDVEVFVYEPSGAPTADKMVKNKKEVRMTEGRAVLLELIERYLKGLLDPMVSLLEVHKLMYFMQESGQELNLNYSKGAYGPYAEKIRHVLNHIEGQMISGYADGGDNPYKEIELIPGAIQDARKCLSTRCDVKDRFEKVSKLIDGFESPMGLELLSTVHWVVKREGAKTVGDATNLVHAWNERKAQFSDRQISIAFRVLSEHGWV